MFCQAFAVLLEVRDEGFSYGRFMLFKLLSNVIRMRINIS